MDDNLTTAAVQAIVASLNVSSPVGLLLTFVFTTLSGFATALLKRKIGVAKLEQDDYVRKYLSEAIENSLEYAKEQYPVLEKVTEDKSVQRDLLKAEAVNYLYQHVPDGLKHFNLNNPQVFALVEARIKKHLGE